MKLKTDDNFDRRARSALSLCATPWRVRRSPFMNTRIKVLRDDIQKFQIEEHYEVNDVIALLRLIKQVVNILEEHDDDINRVSNEIGEHLNS